MVDWHSRSLSLSLSMARSAYIVQWTRILPAKFACCTFDLYTFCQKLLPLEMYSPTEQWILCVSSSESSDCVVLRFSHATFTSKNHPLSTQRRMKSTHKDKIACVAVRIAACLCSTDTSKLFDELLRMHARRDHCKCNPKLSLSLVFLSIYMRLSNFTHCRTADICRCSQIFAQRTVMM